MATTFRRLELRLGLGGSWETTLLAGKRENTFIYADALLFIIVAFRFFAVYSNNYVRVLTKYLVFLYSVFHTSIPQADRDTVRESPSLRP